MWQHFEGSKLKNSRCGEISRKYGNEKDERKGKEHKVPKYLHNIIIQISELTHVHTIKALPYPSIRAACYYF